MGVFFLGMFFDKEWSFKLFLVFFTFFSCLSALPASAAGNDFIVIAHRGASGYRPEHTLEAYKLAIQMGADFIEPDLVSTKDGVLICRHEMDIQDTTDVEQKFPDRYREINGAKKWYAYDFTLAEIKTLRAKERLSYRSHAYDGFYKIPTLQETIDLVRTMEKETGRTIGLYPETKSPTTHGELGLAFEDKLVDILAVNGYKDASAPVFIQSFEMDNLKYLSTKTSIRLIQLLSTAEHTTPSSLKAFKKYAYGVGPYLSMVIPTSGDKILPATSIVRDAHAEGLKVHVWTLRTDDTFSKLFANDIKEMYRLFLQAGVDGYFTDFPDKGVEVKNEYFATGQNSSDSGSGGGCRSFTDMYGLLFLLLPLCLFRKTVN